MRAAEYRATCKGTMIETRRFQDKTAVVTGSSHGIRPVIVVRLASEGAYVVVNCANSADVKYPGAAEEALRLVRETGAQGEIREAEVADTAAMRALLSGVADARGLTFCSTTPAPH
jgi:NAD(P)-dependent dehydrogenase (short-subunit alcohol dehydrogenase family)